MTWFDYAVLLILGLSILLSLVRGFIREVISLVAWFVAYVCANVFAGWVEPMFGGLIAHASVRWMLAFATVFLVTLVVTGLMGKLLSQFVAKAGFGLADKGLGGLFGLARGLLIILVLVTVAGMTNIPSLPGWRQAVLSPLVETMVRTIKPMLPDELGRHFNF